MTAARTLPASERKPRILERHIEEAICNFLEIDGWRSIKMEQNFSERKMKTVGERGMPDRLFIRYAPNGELGFGRDYGTAQVLWVEMKRPKQKLREEQRKWHRQEYLRGALVLTADSIDEFRKFYMKSGLNRRIAA